MSDRVGFQDFAGFGYLAGIVATIIVIQVAPSFADMAPDAASKQPLAGKRISSAAGADPVDSSPPPSDPLLDTATQSQQQPTEDTTAPAPSPITVDRQSAASFIPLDFSIPQVDPTDMAIANATEGSIKVRKLVQAGQKEIGAVDIVISRNSQLFMNIGDARRLLEGNDVGTRKLQSFPISGLISFKTMREQGVDFRYDPSRDLILVDLK